MNFADAIRQAAKNAAAAHKPDPTYVPLELHPQEEPMNHQNEFTPEPESNAFEISEPVAQPTAPTFDAATQPVGASEFKSEPETFEFVPPFETNEATEFAVDAVTAAPVAMPEPPTMTVQTGNVVRLELFLSPEQMNQLFRSLVATQHAMLTLREAAQYLRVHPNTVEHMAQEGELPGLLIEGRWRFPKTSLDEWLNIQVFKKGEGHAA
jgi:excisionase family DNA binding protein